MAWTVFQKSSISKDNINSKACVEFWIPIMSGWFKQPTLCCSIANKMSGGLWAQFVKAAFQHTCLSGWVNDPLHRAVLKKESLSLLLSLSLCLILFHNITEQLEDMHTLKMLTYKVRQQHPLECAIREKQCLNYKTRTQGGCMWLIGRFLNTNPIISISVSISSVTFFYFDQVKRTLSPFMTVVFFSTQLEPTCMLVSVMATL